MAGQSEMVEPVVITRNFINLEKVISGKNPRLLKVLPGFIIRYLKNVIHQEELNKTIYENRDKFGIDFVNAILKGFGAIIESRGVENLSLAGRQILASNHPLGGLDGLALMREVAKIRTDFLFPVNDILMNLPNLKELFIPLNKHGSNAENVKIFNDSLESDKLILFFPAGLVSRKSKNGIIDLEWKKTFIAKAIKYQRDIIPVHISGQNTGFFYNLASLRKKLNIKANIEMLYLVDEMFKQKEKKITITFGKPIPVGVFDKRFTQTEWAELVKNFVYQLGTGQKKVDDNFDYLI